MVVDYVETVLRICCLGIKSIVSLLMSGLLGFKKINVLIPICSFFLVFKAVKDVVKL